MEREWGPRQRQEVQHDGGWDGRGDGGEKWLNFGYALKAETIEFPEMWG